MLKRAAYLISGLVLSLSVNAESIFTISPYVTVEDQGQVTLNFQPAKDLELQIKIHNARFEIKKTWPANKLSKIDFGKLNCDKSLHYTITSDSRTEVDNALLSYPCDRHKPLYFGFMSDTQIKNAAGQTRASTLSKTIAELREEYPFGLIVNGGDIVQHGGYESEWINFFKTVDIYLQKAYLMAAVGNHEYFESPSLDKAPPQFLEYMRNEQSPDLGYAHLDLGRINLLMLNSNFESMTETRIQEQWEWLEAKLKTAQARSKPSLIIMHHSPYSSNLEHVRTIPTRLRRELVPMLEKYRNAKMVLSGHLHMYERSHKAGIVYLTAGPSGGINNVLSYHNPYSVFTKQLTTTFSVFKIQDDSLEVITYSGSKAIIDQFSVSIK